jgi:3-mercaptopyruvate sulfurtransferase SseA
MWATRLWWLLCYFGHDDTSVLDGGLVAWTAAGGPVGSGESKYPPAMLIYTGWSYLNAEFSHFICWLSP